MIIWFALVFPLLAALVLLVFFRERVLWWLYLVLFGVPALLIPIISACSESAQTRASEYWGGYVTEATYTEPWNEWISQTCTRCTATDKDGRCTSTETYDCSYCSDHGPSWHVASTVGSMGGQDLYERVKRHFRNERFVNLGRSSDCPFPRNGNAYEVTFPADSAHLFPVFSGRHYENRVQAAPTLFSFPAVDPAKVPVFQYPEDEDGPDHSSLLTRIGFPHQARADSLLSWYNGRYGDSKQVHAWLLVFQGGSIELGHAQEAYWKGGGKNELVTTVGIDKEANILWCYVFSWSPKKDVSVLLRDSILSMKTFDGAVVAEAIGQLGVRHFVRKHFKDFSYIQIEPTAGAIIGTFISVFVFSVGFVLFCIFNPQDSPHSYVYGYSPRRRDW